MRHTSYEFWRRAPQIKVSDMQNIVAFSCSLATPEVLHLYYGMIESKCRVRDRLAHSEPNMPEQDNTSKTQAAQSQLEEELRASQIELSDTHNLLKAFVEHNPALCFVKDQDGRYLFISQSFCEFFNVSPDRVIGKTDFEWLPENVARQFSENDQQVRYTGKPIEIIEKVPRKDGIIHSIVHKFPIKLSGDRKFVGGIAIDITERRLEEDRAAELSAIVEFSNDAIIGRAPTGDITSWNRGAQKLFGYSTEEILGKHFSILFPHAGSLVLQDLDIGSDQSLEDYELVGATKLGKPIRLSLRISHIHNSHGKLIGTSMVCRDIAKRVEDEERIKQLNSELAIRCTELSTSNAELQSARDEALQASKIKSMFLANMSHELRTPLSAILGMTEVLMLGELTDEQRQILGMVEVSGKNLLQLVNDLLDLSKIEAGKLTISENEFNVRDLINNVLRTVKPEAERKELKVECELSPIMPDVLIGDALRLGQILLNLTNNAIKFTERGFVRIELDLEALHEEMVLLNCKIIDTGIGIAWDDLKLLFQPFSQLDASAFQKVGGSGLGLAISKALVEMMGGRIQVQSEKQKGTTFSFVVQLKKKQPAVEFSNQGWIQDELAAKILSGKKVLVVEDNALMREVAQRQLRRFDIDYKTAEDGEEALELLSTQKFDLILMDCQLPGINGFEVTEIIRKREDGTDNHVPIIAVTASVMKGEASRCINAGMDDFLSKPVSLQSLKEKLVHWLSKARLGL